MRLNRLNSSMIAIAFAMGIAAVQTVRLDNERARRTLAGLQADALQAAADTGRHIYIKVRALGESLLVAERRAVQTLQRADKLDRALGRERRVRHNLEIAISGMSRAVKSDTVLVARGAARSTSGTEIRRATFDVRDAPYTVRAQVVLPPPPAAGTLDLHVSLDTLGLDIRVGCGAPTASGVRPATASVAGPAWAHVRLARVEQAPGVCAARAKETGNASLPMMRRVLNRAGVSAGYGLTRTPSGLVAAGLSLVFGFKVWP